MRYEPPCTVTPEIERLMGEICEQVGRLSVSGPGRQGLRLRRINRIRTIQGSLAIEGNTLSEKQITAILDGKPVAAPHREVQEARNAIEVYDRLDQWDPYREADLLAAHEILMRGLMDFPGAYRSGGVGVMRGEALLHMAPPASRVRALMHDLLEWLGRRERHPLVAGAIFHYEFEFIHPFADGNGRMGRLWQTLILTEWNPVFAAVPVESLVHARQQVYYDALEESTRQSDASRFVAFMLQVILDLLEGWRSDPVSDPLSDPVCDQVVRLLKFLDQGFASVSEMMSGLSLTHRPTFRKNYLRPARELGFLEMKYPDIPQHPGQRYRLTEKGRNMKARL